MIKLSMIMKKLTYISFLLVLFNIQLNAQDLQSDSIALMAIYNACGGSEWDDVNWITFTDLSEWTGVEVSDGRVTDLNLDRRGLINEMPDDIYDLTSLQNLSIRENVAFDITDEISI